MANPVPGKGRPIAAISAEAEALAAEAAARPGRDFSVPIPDIRRIARDTYAPASEAVVAATGVALSERTVAGTNCMVIDPPDRVAGRCIVYFFGGGFTVGSPFEDLPISALLAAKTGAQVIAPAYPLAPEHPYPAGLEICTAVLDVVLRETPGACLCGESAGGNLALGAVLRQRFRGGPVPQALALLSPAVDLADQGDSQSADRDPFLRSADSVFFRSQYIPEGADRTDPGLSPIYGAFDAEFPPVIQTTGTRDYMLSGCVRLDRVLREAGADSTLRVWEGMWHVFEAYPDAPEAEASLTDISEFLLRHMR